MKVLSAIAFTFIFTAVFSQTIPVKQPIEEQYHISYWWWFLGVLIAIGIGVGIYMLIKKDPRKDAVR